ncbi:DUF2474 domain-containing protein [Solilutibacter silvestris]|uniref:DUF2474 domain-containing protein n=1 Tax=Solilutibacter silvestris TaxID=1645665 RepID=A0A2K1Q351_9GAMM|nr:DUF2474 domain-containing protein [Lysobacter silvestris]PNS09472.1 hypothetical protein Lysil_1101 [Lysobacter silvestris]
MVTTEKPPRSGDGAPWWRKLGWFVLLWVCGVLVTFAVASVFKFLILGAVTH